MSADGLLDLAIDAATQAGALIEQMRRGGVEVADTKSSEVDVVTAADRAAEKLIREVILGARPDDAFLGEEGDKIDGSSGVRWIVDPIDGTVNYLYGIRQYAVSVAAEVDGEIVVGAVFSPSTEELFTATRGGGAWLNSTTRLQVRSADSLAVSLIATGFAYDSDVRRRQGNAVSKLLPLVRDVRREGSCALDLCSLAMGRVDGYVEEGTHLWDRAAGGLIAEEAGATVEIYLSPWENDVIVAAPTSHFSRFAEAVEEAGFLS